MRGPAEALPGELFIFKHLRLGSRYCAIRLGTCVKACGVKVTPHQLRHSCATLLLNADYYRAMVQVEQRLALGEPAAAAPPSHGDLIALADALRGGTLNAIQVETLSALRAGLLAWAEQPGGPAQPETPPVPAG
ncbi:MAG: site-specific integrase [Anaerolineales bacterium]|nr:site-specific integrase [Anaerolineales bacterium]